MAATASYENWVPYWPPGRIAWLQGLRLRSTIRHAYRSVPYYRRTMDERGLRPRDFQTAADLEKLPLIDSLTVRARIEEFTSRAVDPRARQTFFSSGSQSGVQKKIYWDDWGVLRILAYSERDRAVLRRLSRRSWGQDQLFILPLNSSVIKLRHLWDAQTLVPGAVARRHFISPDVTFDVALERMNAVRPQVVFSYGSWAEQFFRTLADRKLTAALPRVWSYGADMMGRETRDWIEATFDCLIYSAYGAVETGRIGWECEQRRGFHLNVDECAVRLVDPQGRTVTPGETGELVVSNLHNRATVLLNVRLGDLGVMDGARCRCGRTLPLLSSLEGRVSELIQLADGRSFPARTIETMFRDHLQGALASQIVQPPGGEIRWRLVPSDSADREALSSGLLARSHNLFGPETAVAIDFVTAIPRTPQGKLRRVIHGEETADTASIQGEMLPTGPSN